MHRGLLNSPAIYSKGSRVNYLLHIMHGSIMASLRTNLSESALIFAHEFSAPLSYRDISIPKRLGITLMLLFPGMD